MYLRFLPTNVIWFCYFLFILFCSVIEEEIDLKVMVVKNGMFTKHAIFLTITFHLTPLC